MSASPITYVNIADVVDDSDPQKRTYRQINAALTHAIPLGALVEVGNPSYPDEDDGVRLFVCHQGRDCDETPLYWLSPDKAARMESGERFFPRGFSGGYPEDSLTIIRQP